MLKCVKSVISQRSQTLFILAHNLLIFETCSTPKKKKKKKTIAETIVANVATVQHPWTKKSTSRLKQISQRSTVKYNYSLSKEKKNYPVAHINEHYFFELCMQSPRNIFQNNKTIIKISFLA